MRSSGTEVDAALEDDFHHFRVALRHDGQCVVEIEGRALRWPWSTCPAAAGPLRALVGMPLSPRAGAVGEWTDPHANCTHLFDLAGLAVAHATRSAERRQYDAEIPFGAQSGPPTRVRLWRDGDVVLDWVLEGGRVADPAPYTGAPWRGGFMRWADATLPVEEAEAAIVLRRACEIGMGRGMDLDAVERAVELGPMMAGVCFTLQPENAPVAIRNRGTIRDFADDPDALLRDDR
jgi:Protein of unknown function (DUF2889)